MKSALSMRVIGSALWFVLLVSTGGCSQSASEPETMTPAQEALKRGRDFLSENGRREGVTTTPSGLQYEVVTLGTGEMPTANNTVTVHYEGTLIDGQVFDSSVARGVPATFPLGGVIPGWTEGLQLMPTGSKFKFYLPTELAYGADGIGPIGPNEVLIFTVELISFD